MPRSADAELPPRCLEPVAPLPSISSTTGALSWSSGWAGTGVSKLTLTLAANDRAMAKRIGSTVLPPGLAAATEA
jgi:hypothetical protein